MIKAFVFGAALAVAAGAASAATVVYTDVDDYLNVATTSVFEDFQSHPRGPLTPNTPVAFNGFSITNLSPNQAVGIYSPRTIRLAGGNPINGGMRQLGWGESSELGVAGSGAGPSFEVTFDVPSYAFGFNFSDNDGDDSYQVTIGGRSYTLGTGLMSEGFIGFVSSFAFNSVTFSQLTSGGFTQAFAIDNFKVSNVPPAPVPLPAGLPLLAAGLAGLGLFARRRARRA